METLKQLFHRLTDAETLVADGGLSAMTLIVFAETGLLIGFFLPGDSLLVAAGVLAVPSVGLLDIALLNALLIPAAVLGDAVNYSLGHRTGPRVFSREPPE